MRESERKKEDFPSSDTRDLKFNVDEQEIHIQILCRWKRYSASMEGILLNGSYCFSNESFKGTKAFPGPVIDTKSAHPGESWHEITDENFILPKNRILIILKRGDPACIREGIGPRPLYRLQEPIK